LGALTLAEYSLNVSFGLDTWLPHAHSGSYPGRPSPQTALGLVLLGLNSLGAHESNGGRSLFADVLAVMLVGFDLLMIGGYVYGALEVNGINAGTLMSPHTLFCLSFLTFVIVSRRAKQGHSFAALVGIGIGSQIVRSVLPFAILLPFIFFGSIGYLVDNGIMTPTHARIVATALQSLVGFGIVIWMASRINILERKVRDLSLTEELTQICNRRGFNFLAQQAFRSAVRAKTGLTALFFDLDGLKRANDMIGHDAGSAMIQAFATILAENFRESDVVGRVGGDEFVVMANRDNGQARKALARVVVRVGERNKSATSSVPLSFSVGLAEFVHGSAESLDALVARADLAMYQDKIARKARRIIGASSSTPMSPSISRNSETE